MRLIRKEVKEFFLNNYHSIVGYREQSDSCPLATFIDSTHPNLIDISVDGDYVRYRNRITGEWKDVQLPKWARKFVTAVDYDHDIIDWEVYDYGYEEYDPLEDEYYWVDDYDEEPIYNDEVYGYEALEYLNV